MSRVFTDKDAAIVIEDSHPGIQIATWFGEATVSLVDQYYAWHGTYLDTLRRENRKFVLITDTFASDRPPPAVRKRIADGFAKLGPDVKVITIQSYIVAES